VISYQLFSGSATSGWYRAKSDSMVLDMMTISAKIMIISYFEINFRLRNLMDFVPQSLPAAVGVEL
jgi:hypothetical protein